MTRQLVASGLPTPGYVTVQHVERAINKIESFRAVATRYDKRDYAFRGAIDVASIKIWLRDPAT